VTGPDSTLQARFRELAADPRGEPDPVLDRLTSALLGDQAAAQRPEAEPEAEAGQ
jgi:hypothetical protein